jgi:hypothetical protein
MKKRTLKWIAVENRDRSGRWDVRQEGNFCKVATMLTQDRALLIAAAPELLAALELMLSSPTYGNEPSDEAVEAARAAVAKAKGPSK